MKIYDEHDNYGRRLNKILEKAEGERTAQKKRRRIALVSVLSSAAALILALNLALFVPYTVGGYNISAYKKSEYYALMNEIGSLNCTKPRRTNNFQEAFRAIFGAGAAGAEAPGFDTNLEGDPSGGALPDEGEPPTSDQHYEEVTNNQVQGVVEGDLLKRSDKYLYYLSYAPATHYIEDVLNENGDKQVFDRTDPAKLILNIYTVSGEKVNTYEISDEAPYAYNGYGERREMYLTSDCTKILILVSYYDGEAKALFTRIFGIDVSDPTAPREFARTSVSGDYVSSRLVGNTLLLISNFAVTRNPDFAEQRQYLPAVNGEIVPMADIVLPEKPTSARYTVLSSFAADTLSANDCEAYFDFSEDVYVSAEHIYTTREKVVRAEYTGGCDPLPPSVTYTEIACTSYDGMSLTYRGEVSAIGTIVDQYSLDEHKGVLRVFTTGENYATGRTTCNLWCFDLSTFEQIAAEEDFAPGESVKSVRFDGDTAYACTAEVTYYEVIDPVFKFDLRDYRNITFKKTDTLLGYSLNLVKFFGGTLLGIGYGDRFEELKIEVYSSGENKVDSVCQYKLIAGFSKTFKAYFIDAESGLVGLQIDADDSHKSGYLVLRFDGYHLVELTTVENVGTELDDARACLIDGTLYIFGCTSTGECVLNKVEV